MLIISCWNIFMMAAIKSSLINLTSLSSPFFSRSVWDGPSPWYSKWFLADTWTFWALCYKALDLIESSCFSVLPLTVHLWRKAGAPSCLPGGNGSPGFPLSLCWRLRAWGQGSPYFWLGVGVPPPPEVSTNANLPRRTCLISPPCLTSTNTMGVSSLLLSGDGSLDSPLGLLRYPSREGGEGPLITQDGMKAQPLRVGLLIALRDNGLVPPEQSVRPLQWVSDSTLTRKGRRGLVIVQ